MSLAWGSWPGGPGIRAKDFTGDGTGSGGGRGATGSVVIRGSCRCCRISFVYSSSFFCGVGRAAARCALTSPEAEDTTTAIPIAANRDFIWRLQWISGWDGRVGAAASMTTTEIGREKV